MSLNRKRNLEINELTEARLRMVDEQIAARGIRSEVVLGAMRKVPRHLFIPEQLQQRAYEDQALPLGPGQSISQPYIVALMLEALELQSGQRVLEVGTGSGYQAALLAEMGAEVFSVELDAGLVESAAGRLGGLGYAQIMVTCRNGVSGWPEQAPFDRIILSAAPEEVPRELISQLAAAGRLLLPLGSEMQRLILFKKEPGGLVSEDLGPVRFVPLRRC